VVQPSPMLAIEYGQRNTSIPVDGHVYATIYM
jgi:hypothetical protein